MKRRLKRESQTTSARRSDLDTDARPTRGDQPMSIGREDGTANFTQSRQIAPTAAQQIDLWPGKFNPDRRSDSGHRAECKEPLANSSVGACIGPALPSEGAEQGQRKRHTDGKPECAAFLERRNRSRSGGFTDAFALVLEAHCSAPEAVGRS